MTSAADRLAALNQRPNPVQAAQRRDRDQQRARETAAWEQILAEKELHWQYGDLLGTLPARRAYLLFRIAQWLSQRPYVDGVTAGEMEVAFHNGGHTTKVKFQDNSDTGHWEDVA